MVSIHSVQRHVFQWTFTALIYIKFSSKKNQELKEMKGNEMKIKMNSKGSICDIFTIFICS